MTKQIFFILAVLCTSQAQASVQPVQVDTIQHTPYYNVSEELQPIQPVYLDGVVLPASRTGNWFVSIAGGTSAFLGTPRLRSPLRTLETLVQFRSRKMVHSVRRRTYQLQRCAVQRWHIVQSGLPPYPCGSAVECPWPQICPARTGTLESCSLCRCRPVTQCL